jgi:hypothetical protein
MQPLFRYRITQVCSLPKMLQGECCGYEIDPLYLDTYIILIGSGTYTEQVSSNDLSYLYYLD